MTKSKGIRGNNAITEDVLFLHQYKVEADEIARRVGISKSYACRIIAQHEKGKQHDQASTHHQPPRD